MVYRPIPRVAPVALEQSWSSEIKSSGKKIEPKTSFEAWH